MSFLKWRKKKPCGPVILEKTGYWNGICPFCKTHIGIDVLKHPVTGEETALCAACGADIPRELRERVEK